MRSVIIFAAGLLIGAAVAPQRATAVQQIDTQKLLIENPFVRVFEIRVAPGVAEPMHSHARGLTIALSDYDNETKTRDGRVNRGHTRFGEVRWAEPVTHEAKNVGASEQHVIRIELK